MCSEYLKKSNKSSTAATYSLFYYSSNKPLNSIEFYSILYFQNWKSTPLSNLNNLIQFHPKFSSRMCTKFNCMSTNFKDAVVVYMCTYRKKNLAKNIFCAIKDANLCVYLYHQCFIQYCTNCCVSVKIMGHK